METKESSNSKCCQHCSNTQQDHDLLVKIAQKLDTDFAALKDHESRLRRIEFRYAIAIGGLFVSEIAMGMFFTYYIASKFNN